MPTTPDARHRLAELMEDRRLELGLRWQDVVDAATAAGFKVSLKALHSVRTGTAGLRPLTQRAIEAGLRWEHGSIQRIEDGGDPVALSGPPVPVTGPLPVIALAPPLNPGGEVDEAGTVSSVTRNVVLAAINPHEHALQELIHSYPEGTRADEIFSDPLEAALFAREYDENGTEVTEIQKIREILAVRAVRVRPPRREARRAG